MNSSLARWFTPLNHDILNTHRMRAWTSTNTTNKAKTVASMKNHAANNG